MKLRPILLSTTASLAALTGAVAAQAQPAGPGAQLEEIVVTATRREESLQRVPVAVTAVGQERLEQSSVTNLAELSRVAPSLQVMPAFVPGNAVFQIRGQIITDTTPTIDPSVGIYFDDVYISRAQGSLANFLDLARVEVLKGPQGTLFGRNTTGGAVRLISNQPKDVFEGYGKIGYQSYDQFNAEGVLNIPLNEMMALRLAGQIIHKDGGYDRNPISGKIVDWNHTQFGRASLRIAPNDKLTVVLQGDYTHTNAGGVPNRLVDYIPGNAIGNAAALAAARQAGLALTPANGNALLAAEAAAAQANPYDVPVDLRGITATSATIGAGGAVTFNGGRIDPFNKMDVWGTQATISYDFGWGSLKSITAYRDVEYDSSYNVGPSRYLLLLSRGIVDQHQWSQEFILNGQSFDDRLNWTVGGNYFSEKVFQDDDSSAFPLLVVPGGTLFSRAQEEVKSKSWGVFAQADYKLTDALTLTGGVRYTEDKRDFLALTTNYRNNGVEVSALSSFPGYDPTLGPFGGIFQSSKFNHLSYTAALRYQFTPSAQAYIRTSNGYRQGGFNARIVAVESLGAFRPEVLTDYEFGVKADWFDRRLRTNLAVFRSKTKDTQLSANLISPTNGASVTRVSNVGVRKVKGAEAEVTLQASEWLVLDASVGWLDGKIRNPNAPDSMYLPNAPKWTYTIGGTADIPISEAFRGILRVDGSYRSRIQDVNAMRAIVPVGPSNAAVGPILYVAQNEGRFLANLRATLHHEPSGVEVSVFATNLFDKRYDLRVIGINGTGIVSGVIGEPRVIGVDLKVPFGAMAGN